MSTDREVARIVRSWLEEGVTTLPDRVLDAVLDQVPATRQRRAWWPAWRLPHMNTPLRIAGAAAAVAVIAAIVIAVVGFNARPSSSVGGGPPTPSHTPAPTLPAGQIPSGTYQAGFVTYTLPAGWSSDTSGGVTILKPNADPPNGMAIDLWQNITTVYTDPCHWQTTAVPVGPTAADLVAALASQHRTPSGGTPGKDPHEWAGFQGTQVALMVPLDVNTAACDGGEYKAWTDASGGDRYNQGPGQYDVLDIVSVTGRVLVIQRSFYPANSAADLAELTAIVNSISIRP